MRNLWTKIKKCLQAEMLQKMWKEFLWIAQYARRYWKAMIFYTALGVFGTGVSLASSVQICPLYKLKFFLPTILFQALL